MNRPLLAFRSFVFGIAASLLPPLPAAEPETPDLGYYLPPEADHDPAAPTPEGVLGWRFGAWHLHHHELVAYLRALDAWSDRLSISEYARSHGRRPLLSLAITSPANQARLEEIRAAHLARVDAAASGRTAPAEAKDEAGAPLVLWMGYGVHGNEPSASQAAALLAYHLAASRAPLVADLLENAVVLLDPCLNPDGMERFAAWSNDHRGRVPSPHRADREHREGWPNGRSNYYWFDLNRDWLPAVHPESQGRLRLFHRWMPHLVTDYHEMGNVNRTYFFQPGIPEMVHPLTPAGNQDLTAAIARHHAKALDALGSLYYTRESFDDFYIGKGSTYPDLCGSVGILFEQASSRGFHQDTEHGRLEFPFTIRNQVATSLSTLAAAAEMREALSRHLLDFQREAMERAAAAPTQAHVLAAPGDPQRLEAFRRLLDRHGIRHAPLRETISADGLRFPAASSLVVPARQPRHDLLTAMLERRAEFASPVFYDVSAWHLPSAYGLLHAELEEMPPSAPAEAVAAAPPRGRLVGPEKAVAYLLPWEALSAPAALWRLAEEGVRVWAAQRPVRVGPPESRSSWARGTLVVPVGPQDEIRPAALRRLMRSIASEQGLRIRAVDTALGTGGIDLGSPSLSPLRPPKVLLLVGQGVSSTAAGDVWHQFDQVWGAPLTMAEPPQLTASLLTDFNTLILADAPFAALPAPARAAIESWVSRGGCLVAFGSSVPSLATQKWVGAKLAKADFDERKDETEDETKDPSDGTAQPGKDGAKAARLPRPDETPYDKAAERRADRDVRGVVVRAWYDATHPLAYGYSRQGPHLALLRRGTTFLEPSPDPSLDPLRYTDDPLVSGHLAGPNLKALKGSVAVQIRICGAGRVVLLADNPVFRGHWHGSSKLLANAIFFAPSVAGGAVPDPGDGDEEAGQASEVE